MKLWLDDVRPCPQGWVLARSVNEAIALIESVPAAEFEFASLDHDLGDFADDGGDGYKLTRWMLEFSKFPSRGIRVHSANNVGAKNMLLDVADGDPYGDAQRKIYSFDDFYGARPSDGWPLFGGYKIDWSQHPD